MESEETNPPVKKSSRNLDHLTEVIGRFGRYQTVLSVTLSLTGGCGIPNLGVQNCLYLLRHKNEFTKITFFVYLL